MTRKRIGSGLLESFSETCDHCNGRGIRVSLTSVDHNHESPKSRKPAGFVDPAEAAARSLAAHEEVEEAEEAEEAAEADVVDVTEVTEVAEVVEGIEEPVVEAEVPDEAGLTPVEARP
jgi:ribonuclease E